MAEARPLRNLPSRLTTILTIATVLSSLLIGLEPLLGTGFIKEADALRPVSLSLSLYPRGDDGNVVDIMTGPGMTGRVSVRGKVDLFRSARVARARVLAELHFQSERPDLVLGSVFPPLLEFDPSSKFNHTDIMVNFQLTSPMLNYSSSIGGLVKVTVWGEWFTQVSQGVESWSTGEIEEFYIYVNIKPFHYLDLMFDPPMVQVRPGEPVGLDVVVRNRGNGYERVELTMPSEGAYALSGWSFEFESTVLDIPPWSESSVRLKIVPPRRMAVKYHMEVQDFNVRAVSHNSKFQVSDGDRSEENWFEMSFSVYTLGLDAVFVPFTWTLVLYLIALLVLFNLGIRPTLRRRKLPKGKYPGFIALCRLFFDPKKQNERSMRRRRARAERERARMDAKERNEALELERKAERDALLRTEPPPPRKAITLAAPAGVTRAGAADDFDIDVPASKAAPGPRKARSKPFLDKGGNKRFEKEVLDVLGSLDDDQ